MNHRDMNYREALEYTLLQLEEYVESLYDALDIDADYSRAGGVLNIDFGQYGKVVVNAQPAVEELWLACKAGGFHYRWKEGQWLSTRESGEFYADVVRYLSQQLNRNLPEWHARAG